MFSCSNHHDQKPVPLPPPLPVFTGHTTEVLQALCRHTHGSPCPTPDLLDLTPTPMLSPAPVIATYAEAVAATATDPVTTNDMYTPTHTPPPSERLKALTSTTNGTQGHTPPPSGCSKAHVSNPDLVFHINCLPHAISARPPPFIIFSGLRTKSIIGDLQLAGVCWTPRGNLTIAFLHNESFTMEEAIFDTVPPGSTAQECVIRGIDSWLEVASVVDRINEMSFMCTDAILPTRETASLRVSLSSRRDADLLIQNGALVLGSCCRVSKYVAKAWS
ncbi:hypothetical protein B0H14DRAFT_2816502 [Mycena olivaceomarginata]|nr:hypothetical protein B0H14DRAFT_2816502 [Mycena olivaceomarginata]